MDGQAFLGRVSQKTWRLQNKFDPAYMRPLVLTLVAWYYPKIGMSLDCIYVTCGKSTYSFFNRFDFTTEINIRCLKKKLSICTKSPEHFIYTVKSPAR